MSMRLLVAVVDGPSMQRDAERMAAAVQSQLAPGVQFSGIVAVTLFNSDNHQPVLLRAEFLRRYERVNVDLEVSFTRHLDSPERIGSLIEAAARIGLKKAGFEPASGLAFPPVQIVERGSKKNVGGLYTLSVFSSAIGGASQSALEKIRKWIETADGVFEDGEVELSKDEVHIYIFCPRSKSKSLQAFVSKEFQLNDVLLIDPDERVVCQWEGEREGEQGQV